MKKILSLTLTLICILNALIACNNTSKQPTINAEIENCTQKLVVIKVTETTENATVNRSEDKKVLSVVKILI